MTWRKSVERGYDNVRYTVYESESHVVTDDDVKPPLVSEADWLPWALYRRQGQMLELVGRFKTARAAKAHLTRGAGALAVDDE